MRSFPSALNRGGNNAITHNKNVQNAVGGVEHKFDTSMMKAYNLSLNKSTHKALLDEANMNIAKFARYQQQSMLGNSANAMTANIIIEQDARLNMRGNDEYNNKDKERNDKQQKLEQLEKERAKLEENVQDAKQKLNGVGSGSGQKKERKSAKQELTKAENALKDFDKKNNFDEKRAEIAQLNSDLQRMIHEALENKLKEIYSDEKGQGVDKIVTKKSYYENPFKLPSDIIGTMNRYKHVYKTPTQSLYDAGVLSGQEATEDNIELSMIATLSVPSMFNPLCNIQAVGMTDNLPLLNDISHSKSISATVETDFMTEAPSKANKNKGKYKTEKVTVQTNAGAKINDRDITNCSIRELVSLSHRPNSILGLARYKYADFMYCKDVGKVSNNHLITLRKFKRPVGDNIFKTSGSNFANENEKGLFDYTGEGDAGRLISWFGTDDNKLEDILNYKYSASWKELNSKIEEVESQEDAGERGPLGMLLNSINPAYNRACLAGMGGAHNLFSHYGAKWFNIPQGGNSQNTHMQRMYDKNRVYTPKNTIQDTNIYEGKLKFEHEITLKFSYKLRAYDNINPKTAFLDLLANILEVTYRRGTFWGGSRRFIGSPANRAGWNKANKFIDEQWDKLGGFLTGLASGTIDFQSIVQSAAAAVDALKNAAQGAIDDLKGKVNANGGGAGGVMRTVLQGMIDLNKKTGFTNGLKAQLKNAVGRPALYAMDSLLSADNVGLWHITIGNPKNPIMVMGNMILTGASIQHKGPLGVDDFPTEITVSVTLKPGRSRDLTEIGRMYTKGAGALYQTVDRGRIKDFYDFESTKTYGGKTKEGYDMDLENAMLEHQGKLKAVRDKQRAKQNSSSSTDTKTDKTQPKENTTPPKQDGTGNDKTGDDKKGGDKTDNAFIDKYYGTDADWLDKLSSAQNWYESESEHWDDSNFNPFVNTEYAMRIETHNQVTDLALRMNMDEGT